MKKSISVSNLTLDLYLDYVRPAALAAGILEATAAHDDRLGDYTVYITDAAAADEIAHCMYVACIGAGNDGIERTHAEYVRHEAERMADALQVSIKYDIHHTAETITALYEALDALLNPTAQQVTETTTETETPTSSTSATETTETSAATMETMETMETVETAAQSITAENATSRPEKPVEPSTVNAYPVTAHHETGAG